ncbi:hypothetical protein [Vreelandella glaciei]|uniref:hypothetical protein n=1 Tax=Vreelandella glaciei TaxID=186761 RepID=UPI0030EC0168
MVWYSTPPKKQQVQQITGRYSVHRQLHAGVVERVTLWTWAWSEFQANWLLGSGEAYSIGGNNKLAGYNAYTSLVAIIASGFGLVGLLGFILILALHLKALLWANLSHHWHPGWGLGVLGCGIAMLIFNLFSMPLNYPSATVLMVLLTAAIQVASFQYSWAKEIDCQSIKKCS